MRTTIIQYIMIVGSIFVLVGLGLAGGYTLAKKKEGNPTALYSGQERAAAADALLTLAERKAEGGSWELIAVGRAWYLGGDRVKGQALFDRVTNKKPEASDWFRIARVYRESNEPDKARTAYENALAMAPKDDTGMMEYGAWLNSQGEREAAEAQFSRAFTRSPKDFWHLVVSGGSYLEVAPN